MKSGLIHADFVVELVTLEIKLQNLGALDKEDPDTGVFFFIHRDFVSNNLIRGSTDYSHAALVA